MTDNCLYFQELASADADNELTPAEKAALTEHVVVCAQCRAWAGHVGFMNTAVKTEMRNVKAPASLIASTAALMIHQTSNQPSMPTSAARSNPKWWSLGLAPAMAAAALIIFFFSLPRTLPVQILEDIAHSQNYGQTFPDVSLAAQTLSLKTGVPARPFSFDNLGIKFQSAGTLSCAGRKAVYFSYMDQLGRRMTVFEVKCRGKRLPSGNEILINGSAVKVTKDKDGCNVLYWPCNGMVLVVCSDMPLERVSEAGRLLISHFQPETLSN